LISEIRLTTTRTIEDRALVVLPCLQRLYSIYHPAVIILESFDVVLTQIIAMLDFENDQISISTSRAVNGPAGDRQHHPRAGLMPLLTTQQITRTIHHGPALASVAVSLE
tara:strand:- start:1886 stop:2215 length:330 start_codon:yes stop_codon:yes gene_type:complete